MQHIQQKWINYHNLRMLILNHLIILLYFYTIKIKYWIDYSLIIPHALYFLINNLHSCNPISTHCFLCLRLIYLPSYLSLPSNLESFKMEKVFQLLLVNNQSFQECISMEDLSHLFLIGLKHLWTILNFILKAFVYYNTLTNNYL